MWRSTGCVVVPYLLLWFHLVMSLSENIVLKVIQNEQDDNQNCKRVEVNKSNMLSCFIRLIQLDCLNIFW